MTPDDVILLTETYPDAFKVWLDRLHDADKGDLVGVVVSLTPATKATDILTNITNEIAVSRTQEENNYGLSKATVEG